MRGDCAHFAEIRIADCDIRARGQERQRGLGQELALVRNIVAALGDRSGVATEAGLRTHATSLGVFGLAVMGSPTVRAGIDVAMRYFSLMTSFGRAWHVYHEREWWLYLDDSAIPSDLRGFLLERDLAALLSNWLVVFGAPPRMLRGEVAHGLRPWLQPILRRFDVPAVDCVGPHIAVFDAVGIDAPMPQASPHTVTYFEEQCAELSRRRGLAEQTVAGSVRAILMRRMSGRLTQEDVAVGLHMSLRTMRRRLAEEGTSYRRLCAETYGELAEQLLAGGLTVEDVAYRMGYAGAPSFSAAFKQWRGMPPGRFARAAAEGRAGAGRT
nr:AraC family transcriptional regulator [Nocardia bovistercoris]